MRSTALAILFLLGFSPLEAQPAVRFAAIGDYGLAGQPEHDVASLVSAWQPDFIITLGDNNYENGAASTIDPNIGQYYHAYIAPYTGGYGSGDTVNRFFPSLGNHDWRTAGAQPYRDYFSLPGNERYYDFAQGPVHFFVLDSDTSEPDGRTSASPQAQWLAARMAAAVEPWKLVYFHHPPYTSGTQHGPTYVMRWPFAAWGASAVLAGHEHLYERIHADGIVYFVNGLGGKSLYPVGPPAPGNAVLYNADYGAMFITATQDSIVFEFRTRGDSLIDRYSITKIPLGAAGAVEPATHPLLESYPNPFNPSTTLTFSVTEPSFVRLDIANPLGQVVDVLFDGPVDPGEHSVRWDAADRPSGMYWARLTTGDRMLSRKLAFVR